MKQNFLELCHCFHWSSYKFKIHWIIGVDQERLLFFGQTFLSECQNWCWNKFLEGHKFGKSIYGIFTFGLDVCIGQPCTKDLFDWPYTLNSHCPSSEHFKTAVLLSLSLLQIFHMFFFCICCRFARFFVFSVLLLRFVLSRWKCCFRAISGNPIKMHKDIPFLIGWNGN